MPKPPNVTNTAAEPRTVADFLPGAIEASEAAKSQ